MGLVTTNDTMLYERMKAIREAFGGVPSDLQYQLAVHGLETFELRMEQIHESTLKIAKWLEDNSLIRKVNCPLLPSHPQYSIMQSQSTGCGGLFSFFLNFEEPEKCKKFLKTLRLFKFSTSLGGVESTIDQFVSTMKYYYTREQMLELGYTDALFRVSIGCEDAEDLLADLDRALKAASA